jgi:hypothetical protein
VTRLIAIHRRGAGPRNTPGDSSACHNRLKAQFTRVASKLLRWTASLRGLACAACRGLDVCGNWLIAGAATRFTESRLANSSFNSYLPTVKADADVAEGVRWMKARSSRNCEFDFWQNRRASLRQAGAGRLEIENNTTLAGQIRGSLTPHVLGLQT